MTSALARTSLALALAVLLGFAAPAALAQQKRTIAMKAQVGQSWDFSNTLNSDMTIKTSAQGQVQNIENGMAQKRVGTITVVKVGPNGVPATIRIAFGKDCTNNIKANGQEQAPPFPLAGQSVTLTRGADGAVGHDLKMNLDPATEAELKQMIEFDTSLYPQQPVGLNDEWTPDPIKLKQQLQLSPDDKLDLKCKLLKVGSIRNVNTYDIGLTGSVAKNQDGIQMSVKLGGVIQVHTESGLPIQSNVVVQIGLNGNQQAPGADGQPVAVTINGGGQIRMEGSASPKEGFGGGDAVAEAPGLAKPPANPLDPKPMPPAQKPETASGDAEESPFAGSFKGKQLSADFTVDGQKVTGQIKLGNRSFPATGTVEDGKLKGAFEADGAKFQFIASLDGQTLNLDSEGNKYILQKDSGGKK